MFPLEHQPRHPGVQTLTEWSSSVVTHGQLSDFDSSSLKDAIFENTAVLCKIFDNGDTVGKGCRMKKIPYFINLRVFWTLVSSVRYDWIKYS